MKTATFTSTGNDMVAGNGDVASVLIGISGVGTVDVDNDAGTVKITYDGDYLSEASLSAMMKGAGYGPDSVTQS